MRRGASFFSQSTEGTLHWVTPGQDSSAHRTQEGRVRGALMPMTVLDELKFLSSQARMTSSVQGDSSGDRVLAKRTWHLVASGELGVCCSHERAVVLPLAPPR